MQPHPSTMMLAAFAAAFTLAASPTSVSGSGANGSTETSGATTVTPTGPTGFTYTYAWVRLSGSALINADAPTAPTSTFSGITPNNSTISATFRCTATRSDGQTAFVDVSASLTATLPPLSVNVSFTGGPTIVAGGSVALEHFSVSISGGSGSYPSIVWSAPSGASSVSPTSGSASTVLTVNAQPSGTSHTLWCNCTVTDSLGAVVSGQDNCSVTWS
jgi:hypothetical protein